MKYHTIPIKTNFIKPNEGYGKIIDAVSDKCEENDILIISETPISTAENNLIDESEYTPGIIAYLLTELWSKYFCGYVICPLLRYNERTIKNLRKMPPEARNHKQFILEKYGIKYALQPTAEAGVDLSNVPGQYVSLLPENPKKSAKIIKQKIYEKSGKKINVIIIDTDAVYEFNNKKFTTLPQSIDGILNNTGVFGYFLRKISKKLGPTILASTFDTSIDYMIKLGNVAEKCQKDNSEKFFETVYDMKNEFKTDFKSININLLNSFTHIPAVIIRITL